MLQKDDLLGGSKCNDHVHKHSILYFVYVVQGTTMKEQNASLRT
jgi:hypothetical protein